MANNKIKELEIIRIYKVKGLLPGDVIKMKSELNYKGLFIDEYLALHKRYRKYLIAVIKLIRKFKEIVYAREIETHVFLFNNGKKISFGAYDCANLLAAIKNENIGMKIYNWYNFFKREKNMGKFEIDKLL